MNIQGYHVYRAPKTNHNAFTRLTSTPVTIGSFRDSGTATGAYDYMVRTVKLEQSTSRSYYSASEGILATAPGAACVDGDGDGWNTTRSCNNNQGADCNDGNGQVNPGATEDCDNGADDDCDGDVDSLDSDCTTGLTCNGILEQGEFCDGNSINCIINGYSGTRLCNQSCTGWLSCITSEYCGDRVRNGNEACDYSGYVSCTTNDGKAGLQQCNTDCSGNTSCIAVSTGMRQRSG